MEKDKGQEKLLKLFVIPSIEKPLILGIDFWKEFKLAPKQISFTIGGAAREKNGSTPGNVKYNATSTVGGG